MIHKNGLTTQYFPRLGLLMLATALALVVVPLPLVLTPRTAVAQTADLADVQQRVFELIDRASPAVVQIQRRGSVFSGVIVSPDGCVLTAGHTVVPGERYTIRLPDGRRLVGQSLGASEQMRGERIDCGLIRITNAENLPYLPLGDSSRLTAGQPCLSISFPGGQRASDLPITRLGFVGRPVRQGRMLQSSALMEPGDSGGPLIDLSGRVIGIHSRIGGRMDQNYDMPVNAFVKYWDALNVVQQFSSTNGQVVPKLGFEGRDLPGGDGIAIMSVVDGSIAAELGLQADDILTRIQDRNLTGLRDLQPLLLSAIETARDQVSLGVRRGPSEMEYLLPSQRLVFPSAERLPSPDVAPISLPEGNLQDLQEIVKTLANSLTAQLSSTSCVVTSHISGTKTSIVATKISNSRLLVSKSSQVGAVPFMDAGIELAELEIVARSSEHDLILLRAPRENGNGVELTQNAGLRSGSATGIRQGLLLFSSLPETEGLVSIVGCKPFQSSRQESRGFLGVVLQDAQSDGVQLVEVDRGPAERAGLIVGDVIVGVDDQPVRKRNDMFRFLQSRDPNTQVVAKVQRNNNEFEATITLGSRPNESDHAADLMNKSLRRDGFASVFCHDATLEPDECGGPVYDLDGNWVGINIARFSRVRSYAIPADVVAEFVREYRDE